MESILILNFSRTIPELFLNSSAIIVLKKSGIHQDQVRTGLLQNLATMIFKNSLQMFLKIELLILLKVLTTLSMIIFTNNI